MKQTAVGYALVETYPALAQAIADRPWARALTRAILAPLADLAGATTAGAPSVLSPSR